MGAVTYFSTLESPVGELLLVSDGSALTGLYPESHRAAPSTAGWVRDDALFTGVRDQLREYFAGRLTHFEVKLAPQGTGFQKQVWSALRELPFGEKQSYGALATKLGMPNASRAVGMANGKNPISIIVPCHRVVGSNGALTGYAGGVEMKQWLLEHEAEVAGRGWQLPFAGAELPAQRSTDASRYTTS